MLVVDIIAVLALLVAFIIGISRGLLATIGAIVGMVVGCFAAVWLVPLATPAISEWVPLGVARTAVLTLLGLAVLGSGIALGVAVGAAARRGVDRTRLRGVERFLGGLLMTTAAGLVLVMGAAGLTTAGMPVLSSAVASSSVVRTLDALTPPALDDALAAFRGAVLTDALPRLGDVIGVAVPPAEPPVALDDPDLQRASESVARITGTAYACGSSVTGSGFVAAPGVVVTNAHVVAGVDRPVVELPGGRVSEGRLVYFDPVDDLAVLVVEGLDARPLELGAEVAPGSQAAVQGYPLGGPFTSSAAAVLAVAEAPVPDIYDESRSPREVYALQAEVRPGNSGGPLLDEDGAVIGVVFARGEDGEGRGYAMTAAELEPVLSAVDASDATVDAGRCTT